MSWMTIIKTMATTMILIVDYDKATEELVNLAGFTADKACQIVRSFDKNE